MTKITDKYKRYRVADWLTLLLGLVISAIQIAKYTLNGLGTKEVELVVLVVWIALVIAPKTLNNIIRSRFIKK